MKKLKLKKRKKSQKRKKLIFKKNRKLKQTFLQNGICFRCENRTVKGISQRESGGFRNFKSEQNFIDEKQ